MNWQQFNCTLGFLGHVITTGSLIAAALAGGATLVIAGISYTRGGLSMGMRIGGS